MKKNNIIIGTIFFIFVLIFLLLIEKYYFDLQPFSLDRFGFGMIINVFVTLFIILGKNNAINIFYKYRYVCFIFIIIYLIIMNYNTSNIGTYDYYIQPSISSENYRPVFGKPKSIRSDEWGVTTPSKLSQLNDNYSINNNLLMGKTTIVTLYPKLPTKSIFNITSPSLMGYLILPTDRALTFDNFFEWVLLIFVSFDFCMIITKNQKKYSYLGSVLTGLSPALIWWNSFQIILYGELAIIFINKILHGKNKYLNICWSVLLGWSGACYIMTMYPAWMIPYGYVFLALLIYLLYDNRKEKKFWEVLLYFFIAVCIIALLIIPNFVMNNEIISIISNTSYPGNRVDTGKSPTWYYLFNYIGVLFYSIKDVPNPSELSQFICLFPIPMLLSLYYIIKSIKNKKTDILMALLLVASLILTIYIFFNIPLFAKLTFLTMSTTKRAIVTLGYVNVLLLLRILSTFENDDKIFSIKNIIIFIGSLLLTVILIKIYTHYYPEYLGRIISKAAIIFYLFCISLLMINNKKLNKLLIIGMSIPLIIVGVIILPISKGIDIIYDKPAAKEIQNIVSMNQDGLWLTVEENFSVANYLVANGAPTLNSTNYYPNFELWNKFENFDEYYDNYNRYAHIQISLINSKEKTNMELMQEDLIKLNLSVNDLQNLNIKYIFTPISLNELSTKKVKFNEIYKEDNVIIYEVIYN